MAKNIRTHSAEIRLRRESVTSVSAGKIRDVEDVGNRVGVEKNHVVYVGGYAVELFDNLVDHAGKPQAPRCSLASGQVVLESRCGRAESREGGGVVSVIIWLNEETSSKRAKPIRCPSYQEPCRCGGRKTAMLLSRRAGGRQPHSRRR